MNFYQRYNFVMFMPDLEFYEISSFDYHKLLNVRMLKVHRQSMKGGGVQLSIAPIISPINPYAFQNKFTSFDFGDYFHKEFPVKLPIIFVFNGNYFPYLRRLGYIKYLRHHYPDCKIVFSLTDPVHWYPTRFGIFLNEKDTDELKAELDCILTYNQNDAVNFGLTYYIGGYSAFPIQRQPEKSDVFFIGWSKDRLDQLHNIYSYLTENGFKCDFYIAGVPQELQKFPQEIHYNQTLPYLEVLNHVIQSRGVLEIAQNDNPGLTMRFFEALMYDKNFITDNAFLNQEKFLKSPKLFYIPKYQKFHIDKEKYFTVAKLSNNYKNEYSVGRYLDFLEAFFNSKDRK